MKKIYLLISSITLGSLAFGQANRSFMDEQNVSHHGLAKESNIKQPVQAIQKAAGDVIYETDFSEGLRAVSPYAAWTTSGTNGSVWRSDKNGPNGLYSNASQIINSPTKSNGFVAFEADSANSVSGTFAGVDLSGNLQSPAIDLSTLTGGASLSFYHKYRHCCSQTFYPALEVSTDNFTTVKRYDVTISGIGANDLSATTNTVVNLTSYLSTATNPSNFKFRFVWESNSAYFWQIDDVSLVENPANDLAISQVFLSEYFAPDGMAYSALKEQTSIPLKFADTLAVQAVIKNFGSTAIPSNKTINVKVVNAAGLVVKQETGGTLFHAGDAAYALDGDTISFHTTIALGTLPIGTYKIIVDLNAGDALQTNDSLSRTLKLNDMYYGQENYDNPVYFTDCAGRVSATENTDFVIGNAMSIPLRNDAPTFDLTGLEITLRRNSNFPITVGTTLEIRLHEIDWSLGSNDSPSKFGDPLEIRSFKIKASDTTDTYSKNKPVVFQFDESTVAPGKIVLEGGKSYYVGIYLAGGAESFSYANQTNDFDYSSYSQQHPYGTTDPLRWYWAGQQALTRMVFDASAGLKENKSVSSIGGLYPNPTTGQTTVSYSLENSSTVSVKVLDITGKLVYSASEGTKSEGSHKLSIDASSFNSGVYYVTLTTEEGQLTQKLIKK